MAIDQQVDAIEHYLGEEFDFDVDENHEKTRERQERIEHSNKARAKRKLIRDKHARRHEAGFGGNL
jgi:hypothetical protein